MKDYTSISDLNDEHLFDLIKLESSSHAFEELYNRYWDVLWRFALNHSPNLEGAQDCLQDIFTALWVNRESITIQQSVRAYLYRATVNQILKKTSRTNFINTYIQSISQKLEESGHSTEEVFYEKELKSNIERALDAMPTKMRAVFEASRFEGLSHEEIAQKFDISKETVKSQIKNALKIVRKYVHSLLFNFL